MNIKLVHLKAITQTADGWRPDQIVMAMGNKVTTLMRADGCQYLNPIAAFVKNGENALIYQSRTRQEVMHDLPGSLFIESGKYVEQIYPVASGAPPVDLHSIASSAHGMAV